MIRLAWLWAVLFALAVAFATLLIPSPSVRNKPVVVSEREEQFDEAWNDTMKVVALKKADLLNILGNAKPVVTERIMPDPPAALPPVIQPPEEDDPPAVKRRRHKRHVEADVCRGKGKKYTHGGRSWRCKR